MHLLRETFYEKSFSWKCIFSGKSLVYQFSHPLFFNRISGKDYVPYENYLYNTIPVFLAVIVKTLSYSYFTSIVYSYSYLNKITFIQMKEVLTILRDPVKYFL